MILAEGEGTCSELGDGSGGCPAAAGLVSEEAEAKVLWGGDSKGSVSISSEGDAWLSTAGSSFNGYNRAFIGIKLFREGDYPFIS